MQKKRTNISIRSIALLMALVLVVGIAFVVPSNAASSADLGKLVDYFQPNTSTFTLNANSRFFLASEPTGELLKTIQLAQRQFAADGIPTATPMDIVWGDTKMLRAGDIFITIADDKDIGPEGYKIVAETYATVSAEDVDGLLYGLNMLQKHFRNAKSNSIIGFTTYDTPDTKERTIQLDCARKYFTVEYICNFVKEASWMGYNTLQLHFSEDSGFRMDFWDPAYYIDYNNDGVPYEPTNNFSWICGGHPTSWTHSSSLTGINYADYEDKNMFLSTEEVIQILKTCEEYHIDVIPSFDTPAHVDYLTWRYEQNYKSNNAYSFKSTYNGTTYLAKDVNGCINYSEKTGYAIPQWPYYTCIDLDSAQARAFTMELYIDIANFFKEFAGSTDFCIGGDEPNLTDSSIRAKAWSYSKFPAYINELYNLLSGKGYDVRMFNDFINKDALNGKDGTVEALNPNIQILYWNSPFNSITNKTGVGTNYQVNYTNNGTTIVNDPMLTVNDYVNNGRILYNCINQHTYYVLRIDDSQGDARSTNCHQWEFYGADEKTIYNEWTPNNIRKKGVYTEGDSIVPTAQMGGAYFLTWHDYAAVNTETEIWNDVEDSALETGEVYSLRNRMWSNITKMWNHDINNTLAFDNFEDIRGTLGDFPGLKSNTYTDAKYAKATSLPTATAPIQLADHSALTAALAKKIAKGSYSDESYAIYDKAYNEAILMNNKNNATAEELGTALANLKSAEAGLTIKTNTITIIRRTTINGTNYVIDTLKYNAPSGDSKYEVFIPALNGYKYLRVDDATFTPTEAGDGSGYLSGNISSNIEISMWYENQVDVSRLNNLLADAIPNQQINEQYKYTDASWRVYTTALNNARNFKLTLDTQQATVLALVKALEEARTALVVESKITFIKVEKLAGSFNKNGQIGLYIQTSSNVPGLVITREGNVIAPDSVSAEVQTLTNGDIVKQWLVFLPADAVGTFTYTVTFGGISSNITVTVA